MEIKECMGDVCRIRMQRKMRRGTGFRLEFIECGDTLLDLT